jgi:hypothetical protein
MGRSNLDKEKRKAERAKKANATKPNKNKPKQTEANEETHDEMAAGPVKLGARKALRKALKDRLNDNGATLIANALVEQTAHGDVHSADMLMSLVNHKKDKDEKAKKKKKKSGPSLAELLGSEPEWVDPDPEPADEVEMGGREPEGDGL